MPSPAWCSRPTSSQNIAVEHPATVRRAQRVETRVLAGTAGAEIVWSPCAPSSCGREPAALRVRASRASRGALLPGPLAPGAANRDSSAWSLSETAMMAGARRYPHVLQSHPGSPCCGGSASTPPRTMSALASRSTAPRAARSRDSWPQVSRSTRRHRL